MNVQSHVLRRCLKQIGNLRLCQPGRAIFHVKPNISQTVLGAIHYDLGFCHSYAAFASVCGTALKAAAFSNAWAALNTVSSSNGLPKICRPNGKPSADRPVGSAMPGIPA